MVYTDAACVEANTNPDNNWDLYVATVGARLAPIQSGAQVSYEILGMAD